MCAPVVPATVASGHFEIVTKCASCLPSNLRLCPGRGRSMSALSSPSCTYRVRTRPTVDALINSPLAMSRSIRPSSALSNTSARLTLRAEVSPRLAICPRCLRSDSLNSTLYLRAGMSSYVLLIGSYTRLTYFLYLSNTPRHGTSMSTAPQTSRILGKSASMGKHLRQWTGHRLLKILAQMIRSALAWESDLRVGARPASSGRPIQPSHAAAPPGAEGNPDDRPIGPEREATEVKPDAD